ncbi:MAG: T9SS type A sorting domain-containing protein [Prevotellaceae bacterium]|nr:T9SS type A sorting domain-containing protein [Prevotellaceae bacterium]
MPAGGSGGYSVTLPDGTFDSIKWVASGGIIVSPNSGNYVTVSSKTDVSYIGGYSKYAKGELRVIAYAHVPDTAECNYTCNPVFSYEMDIYKSFSDISANAIVGPRCISPGDSVTYSVAPWVSKYEPENIGFDQYYWTFTDGLVQDNELYYSADKSSVTFIAGTNIVGAVITAQLGQCNYPNQSPLTLTLMQSSNPVLADGIQWGDTICLPLINAGVDTLRIINPQQGNTYAWENLEGWQVSKADTVLIFKPATDSREIRLRVQGLCGDTKLFSLRINRSFSNSNYITSGFNSYCVPAANTATFKVTGAADGQQMTWDITEGRNNGWYFVSDSTIAEPQIHIGTGTGRVSVVAGCGNAIDTVFYIKPNKPGIIQGDTCLTRGDQTEKAYNVAPVDNATSYEWSYPKGWSVKQGTDSTGYAIVLIPNGTTVDSVKVRAIGCSTTQWSAIKLNMYGIAPDTIIWNNSSCLNSGMADTITLSINTITPNQVYNWYLPNTWTIINATQDSTTVTIKTDGVNNTYTVGSFVKNVCGSTDTTTIDFTISGMNLDSVLLLGNSRCWYYRIYPKNGNFDNCNIAWTLDGGGITYPDDMAETNCTYDDLIGSTTHVFYVTVTDTITNCTTRRYLSTKTANSSKQAKSAISSNRISTEIAQQQDMSIYPNPTNSILNVELSSSNPADIFIVDITGKTLKQIKTNSKLTQINISDLNDGIYIVSVIQNGEQISKRFIVKK